MYLCDFLSRDYDNIKLSIPVENLRDKTFFVTGSNGLLGSNIVNYLHYLNTKHSLNLKIIAHSKSSSVFWNPIGENIKYLSSDISQQIPNLNFDYLIHTATYGQPKKFVQNKLSTIKLNTDTLIKLLELSKVNNAKVLFLSSSEVYGQVPPDLYPVTESYYGNVNTQSDRAVYAESKRLAETICHVFNEDQSWIKIVRIAIAYGPGVRFSDSRFMSEFIKRSLADRSLTMLDSGRAVRCFCYITDILEMMLNVLFSSKTSLYNLSGVDYKSIKDVAKIITGYLDVPLNYPTEEEKIDGTPTQLALSNKKYCDEYQKQYFVPFNYGMEKLIDWFRYLKTVENVK